MNYKKFTKQISKINNFFESISEDEDISRIEKDLLLSYIRKLYDSVLDKDDQDKSDKSYDKPKVKKQKAPAAQAPVRKPFERAPQPEPEVQHYEPATSVQEPVRQPFERAPQVAPVAEAIVETAVDNTPTAVVSTPQPETPPVQSLHLSDTMEAIFSKSTGKELSDKLSSLPIKDLTKSLGINERIFTIQELFGGNQDLFNKTLSDVNALSSYDEAKKYLATGVATDQDWDSDEKIKKAEKFVKLVQRRFS